MLSVNLENEISPGNPLSKLYKSPFFSSERCDEIVQKAIKTDAWTTSRHANYPTTDIRLQAIKE